MVEIPGQIGVHQQSLVGAAERAERVNWCPEAQCLLQRALEQQAGEAAIPVRQGVDQQCFAVDTDGVEERVTVRIVLVKAREQRIEPGGDEFGGEKLEAVPARMRGGEDRTVAEVRDAAEEVGEVEEIVRGKRVFVEALPEVVGGDLAVRALGRRTFIDGRNKADSATRAIFDPDEGQIEAEISPLEQAVFQTEG